MPGTAKVSYPVLDPAAAPAPLAAGCALAVMAKAPRPGKVKTRLAPPLTPNEAAAINICFLRDTTENLAAVAAPFRAGCVVSYTPVGDEALFEGLLPSQFTLLPQRGDGFGERLLASAQDLLRCGYASVCLIDSDSPTVPAEAFAAAITALDQPGDRIVLGPSDDGGYYLIGLKQAHAEVFENVTWSTASVFAETLAAAARAEIEVVTLPHWYDIDDAATLATLAAELLDGTPPPFATVQGYAAEHTRQFLRERRQRESDGA